MTVSTPYKVFVIDPYHVDALSHLKANPNVEAHLPDDPLTSDWHTHADAVLLRSDTRLTADDFDKAARLRVVVKQGVGVDNIDLEAARRHGVAVHNTPALNSEAVAELALTLAFTLARRIPEFDRALRAGIPTVRSKMLGLSLFGKTVGVIGMGNIGKEVARKFWGCANAHIIGYDPVAPPNTWEDLPHRRVMELSTLLRESDVITLHVPLLESTRHMIGKEQLALMKPNAILLNTARGGIVDEEALLAALRGNRIWGAALDATVVEPPSKDAYGAWCKLDNVVITPHIGASTRENQSNSGLAAVKIALGALRGDGEVPGKLT